MGRMVAVGLSLTLLAVLGEEVYGLTGDWPLVAETGVFFLKGERLEPPFVLTYDADTLCINGKPLKPLRRPRESIVLTDEATRRHRLLRSCLDRCDSLLALGVPGADVRDTLEEMLAENPLVSEVGIHSPDVLYLLWKHGRPSKELVTIQPGQLPTTVSRAEALTLSAERYMTYLARGWILIVGCRGEKYIPPEWGADLERELDALVRTGQVETDGPRIVPPVLAEEFLTRRN